MRTLGKQIKMHFSVWQLPSAVKNWPQKNFGLVNMRNGGLSAFCGR
jgi:hypothetical protein